MDYANRTQREKELTAAILLLFRDADIFSDPARMQARLRGVLFDHFRTVYVEAASAVVGRKAEEATAAAMLLVLAGMADTFASTQATATAQAFVDRTRELVNRGGPSPDLGSIFGEARAENLGITETTRAANAGTEAGAGKLVAAGLLAREAFLDAHWITAGDASVCPVCAPLNGQPRSRWESEQPGGPPAHPRCRCYLEYAGL